MRAFRRRETIMNRFRRSLPVIGLLGILAVIGIFMDMRTVEAGPQGPPNGLAVNIVNPLPVPTTASITGPVAVAQSGDWNVAIKGTPTVNINPGTNALLIRNIDEPGRVPYQVN